MKRRRFITTLLGTATATWAFAARAQQATKSPIIGFLVPGTPASHGKWVAAFVQRLNELGWIEGRTIAIEYRWAEGRSVRFAEIAAEFVRLKVDVIVTSATPAAIAAKRATSTIPIVFTLLTDPVVTGLVQSMARPGGNITGLTQQASELGGKRLDLLREIVPGLAHVAVMFNSDNPSTVSELREVRAAARSLGLEIAAIDVRRGADIAPAIESINGKAEALYVLTDPIMIVNQVQINSLALDARLPTLHGVRAYVESGGLISYGASFSDLFRRAGDYVDRILRGTKPAEMPIEQPTKFELVINLKTAKSLGLSVPPILITSADELIE